MNLVGFLLQMFVVSRVFRLLGVGRSLFIHPIVALAGYLMVLRAPSVQLMGVLKVADNSLDYSLGNTTKQALWLPTSREAKFKAKQAVDSFFVRVGDVLSAGVVYAGERLALAVPGFAAITLVLVGGWLATVALINAYTARQTERAAARSCQRVAPRRWVPHHAQFEVPAAVAIGAPPDFRFHPQPDPARDVTSDLQT